MWHKDDSGHTPSIKPMEKPIDRWLGLAAFAAGIVFWIMEKTPFTIGASMLLIFALLASPIWNFWWIEAARIRQVLALLILAISLGIFGYKSIPAPVVIPSAEICANALEFAQRMRDFDRERRSKEEEMVQVARRSIANAKNKQDELKIQEKNAESMKRLFDDYQYDYETRLMPKALTLRQHLLNRLPRQNVEFFLEESAFYNVGAEGVKGAANRLDVLAKTLCP